VPLPVSELNASSVTIREDRGAIPRDMIQYVLRNDNPIERALCTARVRQHRLDVATTAPTRAAEPVAMKVRFASKSARSINFIRRISK
jgi:hypothetical protein